MATYRFIDNKTTVKNEKLLINTGLILFLKKKMNRIVANDVTNRPLQVEDSCD